jgi:hypothetical protein
LIPSRPQSLVAYGESGNPSQHYGNKTLRTEDFVLIFGGNWTRGR